MAPRKLLLPIAAFSYLVACTPLPEPVTNLSQVPVTPPQDVKQDLEADNQTKPADKDEAATAKLPVMMTDSQADNQTDDQINDEMADDKIDANLTNHDEGANQDNQSASDIKQDDNALLDDNASIAEAGKKIAEQIPPPPPLPDPFNPVQLVGKTDQMVKTILGQPDYSFREQGVMIWHYKQTLCQILVFISDRPDEKSVIHVDIRAPLLGAVLLPSACYQAVGNRVFEIENN